MAQNVTIAGNQYPSVPSILIPKTGGGGNATFTDTSPTTASAPDVAQGKIFFDSTGTQQTGTASGGSAVIQSLSVTQNGTYTAPVGVDGYSPVTVSVSGGGSSSWTKIAETSYQVSRTETSATTVATWDTGHNELWTSNKWVYVRVRDSAGKRNEYFYGSDQFFCNVYLVNGTSSTNTTSAIRNTIRVSSNGFIVYPTTTTTGYGVYADTLYSDGGIRIRTRYNSTYSLTIDGTYKVEVYLLDPPTGAPIFT